MNDMTPAIMAKSDQLNADDLISGPITIRIRDTKVSATGEQPVSIFYDGDNNKPWKPCKSMARILVAAWGPNSREYIGKRVTLFRDPHVKWAGMEVGGIRVSHMSDIGGDQTVPITVTRGNKKPYLVKPLPSEASTVRDLKAGGNIMAKKGTEALKGWWSGLGGEKQKMLGAAFLDEMKKIAAEADNAQGANSSLPAGSNADINESPAENESPQSHN